MLANRAGSYLFSGRYHAPENEKLKHIHEKSLPLMLQENQYDSWLDNQVAVKEIMPMFNSKLYEDLIVTLIRCQNISRCR